MRPAPPATAAFRAGRLHRCGGFHLDPLVFVISLVPQDGIDQKETGFLFVVAHGFSAPGPGSAAPPDSTQASTWLFLNFQSRPMRCAGMPCLSIHLYTVSLLTPRCLQISVIDNQRSSIAFMLKTPRAFWFAATSARGETGGCWTHLPQDENFLNIHGPLVRSQTIFAVFGRIYANSIDAMGIDQLALTNR